MFGLRGGSALHGGMSVTEGSDNDFGVRQSKIIFKVCQTKCDRYSAIKRDRDNASRATE